MKKLNIVLLACGSNNAEPANNEYPDYLTEQDGKPLIQTHIEHFKTLNPSKITCMFSRADITKFHLKNMLTQMSPITSIRQVESHTKGAACTALLASQDIDNDDELLIVTVNEMIDTDLSEILANFREGSCDAGIVTFNSFHPRYSFVRLNEKGFVVEAAEKNPISNHALAGVYWFSSGAFFVSAAKEMIRNDAQTNNVFYIAPALNELILEHKRIGSFKIDSHQYHPLKNKSQLQSFESAGNS